MRHNILRLSSTALLIAFAVGILSGCNDPSQPVTEQKYDSYLSFTTTEESPMTDSYLAEGIVHKVDLKSKEASEVFQYHHTAMYPLGVYDEQTNCVYYSKEVSGNSIEEKGLNDQIFVHDLTANTDTMLTDDLIAVNDIIPIDENTVFFLGARRDGLLALGKLDPKTKEVQYWKEPAPLTTREICVDREQRRVYAAVFDDEAEYQSMRTDGPDADYTLYSYDYDLADRREILRQEKGRISGLCARDGKLFLRYDSSNKLIDAQTKEVLFESEKDVSKKRCFSEDGKGIYCFLWNEDVSGVESAGEDTGIYYFDFETQEYTPVFTKEDADWPPHPNFQLIPAGVKS